MAFDESNIPGDYSDYDILEDKKGNYIKILWSLSQK